MSTTSLCQVCEDAAASHTCDSCGATVCSEHYDRATDFCSACSSEVRGGSTL